MSLDVTWPTRKPCAPVSPASPIVVAPGVYDPFTALIATQAGFTTLYVSGAAIAYTRLGRPDIGLVSMSEVAETVALIRDRVDGASDRRRRHRLRQRAQRRSARCSMFERAGANAIQLEDQDFPKRCGHLDGKALIPAAEMVGKIKRRARCAALARDADHRAHRRGRGRRASSARSSARRSIARPAPTCCSSRRRRRATDLGRIVAALGGNGVPLMANMVEGGKTPTLSAAELEAIGFALVIFPGGIVRALAQHGGDYYALARRARHHRAVPRPHVRFRRAQRADRHAGDAGARPALRAAARRSKIERAVKTLDPVTLAVLNGRLVQIADEMDATLYRSAFNPIIAEAHDACHGLYHAETGATLVQGTSGLPIFVGAMAFAVKAVIDKVDARRRPEAGRHLSCSTIPMTAARISTISGWCAR